jgi:hypothetical protein
VVNQKVAMLRVSKSGSSAIHPRPLPEIVRVNELAAKVHLNKLGVIA